MQVLSAKLFRLIFILLLVTPTLCINFKFWQFFYKKEDPIKTPLEIVQQYDRDLFNKEINQTRQQIFQLSDRAAVSRDSIEHINRDGVELANIIREIIEYNDY